MLVFGKASDFYRLRVVKLTEDYGLKINWDEQILYRQPPPDRTVTKTFYVVQTVQIDTDKQFELRRFTSEAAADRYRQRAQELLAELTKSEFERRFRRAFQR